MSGLRFDPLFLSPCGRGGSPAGAEGEGSAAKPPLRGGPLSQPSPARGEGFSWRTIQAFAFTLIAAFAFPATPALAQDNAQLEARVAAYRHRVELLEDQNSIENLQATYGYYFDKGLWNQAADLFAPDGTFEYGQRGVYIGVPHIARAMLLFGPQGLAAGHLNNHMQLQAVITVADDGLTAKARWQGMIQLAEPGQNGIWGVGLYENEYVKQKGVWKISKLHFYVTAETDYDAGWLKSAIPMEGPSALFPPDRPPTEVYRSFPGAYIPPFDYTHPVTGKSLKDIPEPADDVVGRK